MACLVLADRQALSGLGLAFIFGIVANGALHAGNYDMALNGQGTGAVGFATAAQAGGIVMAAPLLALLTAQGKQVNLALISGGLISLGMLAMFVADQIVAQLGGRFLLGCGIGLGMAFTEFLVISRSRELLRPLFAIAFGLTLAVGHALGTLLTGIALVGAAPLFLSLAVLVTSLMMSQRAQLPHQQAALTIRNGWQLLRFNPAIFLAAALYGFLDNGFLTMLPDFFADAGLSRDVLVLTSFAAFTGICVLQIPAGLLCAWIEPFALLRATILCLIAGIMLAAMGAHLDAARMASAFMLGGLVDVVYTVALVGLAARMPRQMMASANACFVSFCGIGEMAGPVLTGQALQFSGFGGAISIVLFILAAYWLGSSLLSTRQHSGPASLPSPAFSVQRAVPMRVQAP